MAGAATFAPLLGESVDGYQRFAGSPTQPYGLIGPVRIVPYAEREEPDR